MRRPSLPKLPVMRRPSLPKLPSRGAKAPLSPQAEAAGAGASKSGRKLPVPKLPPLKKLMVPAAAAILVLVALVLALGTYGSDDEQDVRGTLDRFAQASREKDYQALCDDLLSSSLVEKLRTADQPCEVVWRIGLSEVQDPTLEVRDVVIDGDEATAQVDSAAAGQQPLETKILLVQEEGEWRISSLPDEQQPTATTP